MSMCAGHQEQRLTFRRHYTGVGVHYSHHCHIILLYCFIVISDCCLLEAHHHQYYGFVITTITMTTMRLAQSEAPGVLSPQAGLEMCQRHAGPMGVFLIESTGGSSMGGMQTTVLEQ